MASFSELLGAVNSRLGFNAEDPDRINKHVDSKFSFSAEPSKGINVNMAKTHKQVIGDDDTIGQQEKTSTSLTFDLNDGKCVNKVSFTSDKHSVSNEGLVHEDKDWTIKFGIGAEQKPATSAYKIKSNLDINGSGGGAIKFNMNTGVEYDHEGETTINPQINLEVSNEANIGISLETDTKKFTEIRPQFVWKPAGHTAWVRADWTKKMLMCGCDKRYFDSVQMTGELVYGWADNFGGLKGRPFVFRSGIDYDASAQTKVSTKFGFGDTYSVGMDVEHKHDSHWTFAARQTFDSGNLKSPQGPYHVGFEASYKL